MAASGLRDARAGVGAFGLCLEGDVDLSGVIGPSETSGRAATLTRTSRSEIDASAGGLQSRLASDASDDRRAAFSVDRTDAGYRVWAAHHCAYLVAADGASAQCAPPSRGPSWRWQRLVLAQVLPLLAALQGLSLLHAGAVSLGDHVIAIVGRSGSGKTSVALQLVSLGALLMADDVLALEIDGDVARAYPGAAVARVHYSELATLGTERIRVVAEGEKAHIAVPRETSARPLRSLYTLRVADGVRHPTFKPLAPSPALLLGSGYLTYSLGAKANAAQFSLTAALASAVDCFEVVAPRGIASRDVARAVAEHAGWEER